MVRRYGYGAGMLKDAVDFHSVRRVLVTMLRHHGDVLLTSPVFTTLKNHAPHVEIDALVYRDTREMLSFHPAISQVFTIDRRWKTQSLRVQLQEELCLLRALKGRRYDLLVHLTENPRGPVLARLLNARYSVANEYAAKRGRLWRKSFTHLYKWPAKPRHTVERNLDALRRIGVYPKEDDRRLTLVVDPASDDHVVSLLARHDLGENSFIHVHPTSRWMFKAWPVERFAEAINALHDAGHRVVITAAPDERELRFVDGLTAQLQKSAVNLAGELTLKQLAALTRRAKCFLGVDSVPMHIAAAMGTPAVALFGPSGELEWGPWRVTSRIITASFSCRPCGIDGCGGGKVSECLTAVAAKDVVAAVNDIARNECRVDHCASR